MDARKQSDKDPISRVVTDTMELLAKSSGGYQIMDHSRYTAIKYLKNEKTHAAINMKLFKK